MRTSPSVPPVRRPESPTVETLGLFAVAFLLDRVGRLLGAGDAWLALAAPGARPWTLATSVYAHAGVGHLLANAVALALVGFALERATTRVRFHAFVLCTGALAGFAEHAVGATLGRPPAVLGASGAVLALYGYVVAGNPVADGVLARLRLGRRGALAMAAGLALAATVLTGGPGVALVAHFVGFALGLLAGRVRLLRVAPATRRRADH